MWWGSELGFLVWLVLAWALWLALCATLRPRAAPRPARSARGALPARARAVALAAASVGVPRRTVGVGAAVAATSAPRLAPPTSTSPTRVIAAAIERAVPSGTTIDYHTLGTLRPRHPADRAGDALLPRPPRRPRPRARLLKRLGPTTSSTTARTGGRCCSSTATGGMRRMTLVARVHVTDGWGTQTLARGCAGCLRRRARRRSSPSSRSAGELDGLAALRGGVERLDRARLARARRRARAAAPPRRGSPPRGSRPRAGRSSTRSISIRSTPSVAAQLDHRLEAVPGVVEEQRALVADDLELVARRPARGRRRSARARRRGNAASPRTRRRRRRRRAPARRRRAAARRRSGVRR